MLHIQYKSVEHEFQFPFRTAHGVKTHQPALWIAITLHGITGYGEAPTVSYYQETVDSMIDMLIQKIEILRRYSFTEPDRFWHFCHHLFPDNPFLTCALDMAYWDLFAKIKRQTIRQLMRLPKAYEVEKEPITNYTLGMDSLETVLEKMKSNPWPLYKIKVGSADDMSVLQTLRQETDARFRVDANGGWSLNEALNLIPKLTELGVELIEQPLAKNAWGDMNVLYAASEIPLLADESCVSEKDVTPCLACFHGINIKLTKCGGLTPAIRMIHEAKQAGKKVMMGCMSETEIGSYAIAQFLPYLDYVDMDGPLLLKQVKLTRLEYGADGQVILKY